SLGSVRGRGDADGGDAVPLRSDYGRGDTTDVLLMLRLVQGVAALGDLFEVRQELRCRRDRLRREPMERDALDDPSLLGIGTEREYGLPYAGAVRRCAQADV